ncbi:hypothetical protein [Psychrobacillus sp. MER TA 171]|uniref:coiled-coil domain-containing protein n=1 Tax=Psychrobacillus sp. MER TA 171 TaxID=2939577 RepID=UPI00203C408B|nr:hypothetical protein [Psychrobacillus sp. MER TA 171]MCM3358173.1 hypothetical protein [Psychrobacillus sp. MER TA 171]
MEIKEKIEHIKENLKFDPLFEVIQNAKLEDELFQEEFLQEIDIKKHYGTVKIAEWFSMSDSGLRYYIKPFPYYLFDEDAPNTDTAYRLSFISIIKLKMITMLKDEYKIKGLERLIGGAHISYSDTTTLPTKNPFEPQIEKLASIVEQITKTGLFQIEENKEELNISLSDNFLNFIKYTLTPAEIEVNQLKEKENRLLADIKIENLRLDHTNSRIEDISRYIQVMELKDQSEKNKGFLSKLFGSTNNQNDTIAFISKAKEEYEFLKEKLNVVKETIKNQEVELKNTRLEIVQKQKSIDSNNHFLEEGEDKDV